MGSAPEFVKSAKDTKKQGMPPTPGKLCEWIEETCRNLVVKANQGVLYQTEVDNFLSIVDYHQHLFSQMSNASLDVLNNAALASKTRKIALEYLEKEKHKREKLETDLDLTIAHNLNILRDTGQQSIKYVLVGYGAVFITFFNGLSSNKLGEKWLEPFMLSIRFLSVGFIVIIIALSLIHLSLRMLLTQQRSLKYTDKPQNVDQKRSVYAARSGEILVGVSAMLLVLSVVVFVWDMPLNKTTKEFDSNNKEIGDVDQR